jgi:lipooligosaccharide transport system ATP-binding protein
MPGPVIVADNIKKSFADVKAVDGIAFSVPESLCFGLLGPNGAGKSTMLRMLYGVCRRDGGALSVFGHDPQKNPLAIKFVAGVVPQEDNLDEELNVEQNLYLFSRFYDMPRPEARRRIGELLDFMELSEKRTAKIRELSGGMKRRLIIARALLNNPKLLILDEPTTGLDPQVRHSIWDKLRNLKRQGLTIVLTTHYMEEAFQICDTVMIMNKGKRIMEGNPQRLVADTIEPYVMEVYAREDYDVVKNRLPTSCTRVDDTTGVIRVYSCDDSGLRELTGALKPGSFFVRQSNLEDLFLKATGSALNDDQ